MNFIEWMLGILGFTLDVNKSIEIYHIRGSTELERIQSQCWGKPAAFQSALHKQYGYVPSAKGWVKE